ncbi:MAG: MBL fold metallo-hydrolase [Gemmatimonas sp.]
MIERTVFGDVLALRASWPRSRWVGYSVHLFVVRGVLIDTGFPGMGQELRPLVEQQQLRGALLTHHHEDHAGNVQMLAERGLPLQMDAETEQWVRSPGSIGLYRHITWKAMRPLTGPFTRFDDSSLALVSTPGHCRNHHSVWDAETGTLFAGDLYLGVKVRVAHVYENPRAQVQSLRAMAARNPERVFCAHRGLVPNGASMLRAKADWMESLIANVESRIERGDGDQRICRATIGPLGSTHYFSAGDYSPLNLVRAIRNTRPG